MYRHPDERPAAFANSRPFDRPGVYERHKRLRIPRDDGRALVIEALSLLAVVAVLALTVGVAVGIPLALMLKDLCSKLSC